MIATSPATAPDAAPSTVGLPRVIHSVNIQPSAAAAAAVFVVTKARDREAVRAERAARVEAEPAEPEQAPRPITVNGRLCGGIGWWP